MSPNNRVAQTPFDDTYPGVDAIILSSDGVEFHVIAAVLSLASPVFKDCLEAAALQTRQHPDGKARWRVSEDSATLDGLLRYIYPTDPLRMENLSNISSVLDMATKYSVTIVSRRIVADKLNPLVTLAPLRVYAIAYRNKMQDLVVRAANSMKSIYGTPRSQGHLDVYIPELELIDANTYSDLLKYVKSPYQQVIAVHYNPLFCVSQYSGVCDTARPHTGLSDIFNFSDADITIRSSEGIDFRVHKLILKRAFDVFAGMFEVGSTPGEVVQFQESTAVCDSLLRFCYPYEGQPCLSELKNAAEVLAAALKYAGTEALVSTIRTQYESVAMNTNPLSAYAIACQMKKRIDGQSDAQKAARRSLARPVSFVPEMADMSAGDYYRLLEYHEAARGPLVIELAPNGDIASKVDEVLGDMIIGIRALDGASESTRVAVKKLCLHKMTVAVTNNLEPARMHDQLMRILAKINVPLRTIVQVYDGALDEFNKAAETVKLEWKA